MQTKDLVKVFFSEESYSQVLSRTAAGRVRVTPVGLSAAVGGWLRHLHPDESRGGQEVEGRRVTRVCPDLVQDPGLICQGYRVQWSEGKYCDMVQS